MSNCAPAPDECSDCKTSSGYRSRSIARGTLDRVNELRVSEE